MDGEWTRSRQTPWRGHCHGGRGEASGCYQGEWGGQHHELKVKREKRPGLSKEEKKAADKWKESSFNEVLLTLKRGNWITQQAFPTWDFGLQHCGRYAVCMRISTCMLTLKYMQGRQRKYWPWYSLHGGVYLSREIISSFCLFLYQFLHVMFPTLNSYYFCKHKAMKLIYKAGLHREGMAVPKLQSWLLYLWTKT